MLAFLRHTAWALVITLFYGLTLDGPLLLGLGGIGWKLVVAGLGGYAGTAIFTAILTMQITRRGTRAERVAVSVLTAVFATLSAITYVGHKLYFTGAQAEYFSADLAIYSAWIFVLSLSMRAFMAGVLRSAALIR